MIDRQRGIYTGRNRATAYKDLVWTVATAADTSVSIEAQTRQTLDTIAANLQALGSDKTRIVSAQVYLADITHKAQMDQIWNTWIGDNPDHWPQRACLGVALEGDVLIEVTVTAVREI